MKALEQLLAVKVRASNCTVPVNFKFRVTEEQREKLERAATARGVSVATILRSFVDGLK